MREITHYAPSGVSLDETEKKMLNELDSFIDLESFSTMWAFDFIHVD
jgi:hypothetical protein